jgi:hypothetical protein
MMGQHFCKVLVCYKTITLIAAAARPFPHMTTTAAAANQSPFFLWCNQCQQNENEPDQVG